MLRIDASIIKKIESATSTLDLGEFLQKAIELEHSTIPPYLTAMYSLMPESNLEIKEILYSIAREEMLHFTIACNILNAIGGSPTIYTPSFIPNYPSTLPLNINNSIEVGLERISKTQIKEIFMEIEEPEEPLVFPQIFRADVTPAFATIGQFYNAIQKKIDELELEDMPGDKNLQVTSTFYGSDLLFPIIKKKDAISAINIIVEQGEGTKTEPLSKDGEIAHYYRFNEIYIGKRLKKDNSVPEGYSYSGDSLVLDEDKVYPILPNTKVAELPIDSEQRKQAELFNNTYSIILKKLHECFNGNPNGINNAIMEMYRLSDVATTLVSMSHPTKDSYNVGPPFEFVQIS